MLKRLMLSVVAALFLAVGGLALGAHTASAGLTASAPASDPALHVDPNLIQVKQCGPWNNWCGGGGGGCGPWNNWCQPQQKCGPWNNWCNGGGGKKCGPWNNWCNGGGDKKCGSWNNWCNGGGGGGGGVSGCVWIAGVKVCLGGKGKSCYWKNGNKYCN